MHGELGIVATNEDGRVQCHICGRWFRSVSNHVFGAHHLTIAEYLREFGLNRTTGMVSAEVSARKSQITKQRVATGSFGINEELRKEIQKRLTPEVRAKNTLGSPRREQFYKSLPNIVVSEKQKRATAERNRQRVWTDEAREKVRQAHLGKHQTEEAKEKLREFWTGRKRSEENRAKLREFHARKKIACLTLSAT